MQLYQWLFNGIAQGCIYGLMALGVALIYKINQKVSLAQGDLMMLGGFGTLAGMTVMGLPWWWAVLCAVAGVALLGMLLERIVIRPFHNRSAWWVPLLTLGMGYGARGFIAMIPGIDAQKQVLPLPYTDAVLHFGGTTGGVLHVEQLLIIATTGLLCGLLFVLLTYTKFGIAMQACAQNPLAASYMGISVKRMHGLVWGLACALAAIAGAVQTPTGIHTSMGWMGLHALAAAAVRGFGSLPGALVGGLTLGVVESLAAVYLPDGIQAITAYGVMALLWMRNPNGLFDNGQINNKRVQSA